MQEKDSLTVVSFYTEDRGLIYGVFNQHGDTIVPVEYALIGDFLNGFAPAIEYDGRHGIIDEKGNMVFVFDGYEHAIWNNELCACDMFVGQSEGRYMIQRKINDSPGNYEYGFVSQQNRLITKKYYTSLHAFSEGYAVYGNDSLFGFIDSTGAEVIKPTYAYIDAFSEGYAAFSSDGPIGFLDTKGLVVVRPQFTNTSGGFSCGVCAVTKNEDGWGDFYYIDKTGKAIINGPFEEADPFRGDTAFVKKRGVCRVIDKNGRELRKLNFDCFGRC